MDLFDLSGKTAVVTGGSSGIGLAAAERFLAEESRVFIAGLDAAEVGAVVTGLRDRGEIAGIFRVECDAALVAVVRLKVRTVQAAAKSPALLPK